MTSSAQGKRDALVQNVEKYEGTRKHEYYIESLAKLNGFDLGYSLARNEALEILKHLFGGEVDFDSLEYDTQDKIKAYEKGDV